MNLLMLISAELTNPVPNEENRTFWLAAKTYTKLPVALRTCTQKYGAGNPDQNFTAIVRKMWVFLDPVNEIPTSYFRVVFYISAIFTSKIVITAKQ